MSRSVFISYARNDQQLVKSLTSKLDSLHYSVWYDDQITGGSDWWETILSNIRKADTIITVISPDFLASVACEREYKYALSLNKPLLPLRINAGVDPSVLRIDMQCLHLLDFFRADKVEVAAVDSDLRKLPLAAAMPNPLPEPPAIPLSPIAKLREQVLTPAKLSEEDQVLLLHRIKKEVSRNQDRNETYQLLETFRNRNDVLDVIASEVDEYKRLRGAEIVVLKEKGAALETDKSAYIDAAKEEIWFIGATMHYTAGNRRETVLNKLKEGVSIRALILDLDGKMYDANAAQFGQTRDELELETKMTILGFRRLNKEWNSYLKSSGNDSPASLDVRVIDEVFSTGVYLFDPEHAHSKMVIIPHVIGHDATEVPGLVFSHANEKYIKLYFRKIRTAWESGKSIFEQV